jgi:hypothetical protein
LKIILAVCCLKKEELMAVNTRLKKIPRKDYLKRFLEKTSRKDSFGRVDSISF